MNTNDNIRENILGKEAVLMNKRKVPVKQEPTLAPGMNDQDELEQSATENDVDKGDFTSVTTLSYDEVDPSKD